MAWELLPVNYSDAVWSGLKRYAQVNNEDGTVSFQDVTVYSSKEYSFFGALDANRMNEALNIIMSMVENGTGLYEAFQDYFNEQQTLFENTADTTQSDFATYIADLEADADTIILAIKTNYQSDIEQFENVQEQIFATWFEAVRDQLSKDAAGNLQNQCDDLDERLSQAEGAINEVQDQTVAKADKATTDEATSGTDDTKWMTPLKTAAVMTPKRLIDSLNSRDPAETPLIADKALDDIVPDIMYDNTNFEEFMKGFLRPASKSALPPTLYKVSISTAVANFNGGVLTPNGKVIFIPGSGASGAVIGIYDPVTNTYTDGPVLATYTYHGGVLAPNGKVIFIPRYSNAPICIYDPVANTYTNGPSVGSGVYFNGGVLAPNGNVIFVPTNNKKILVFMTRLLTRIQTARSTAKAPTHSMAAYWPRTVR
jgi:hypothetical protein